MRPRARFFVLFLLVGASLAHAFPVSFDDIPGALTKPDRIWVVKTLDRAAGILSPKKNQLDHYLSFPTRAAALTVILTENSAGVIDRFREFGLRFIEFMPVNLYQRDPASGALVDSDELASFTNVKTAAAEALRGGDFLQLLEFPWEAMTFRGEPFSRDPAQRMIFQHDYQTKPFFRALFATASNRDRKRGAWVLKNFLCDDLTPVGIDTSSRDTSSYSHPSMVTDRHASEIGCRSCHWKLDYVSPFFRYIGAEGESYQKKGKFLLYASIEPIVDKAWDDYMAEWRDEKGSWALGIRRGNLAPASDDWNASATIADPIQTDLFRYLKTAPEFQRCLARRMAENFVGGNLSYDSGWIESLAGRFKSLPVAQSGQAFLRVLAELFFSRAYSETNPDPAICYDSVSGAAQQRIPCQVFQVLESRCISCHGDLSLRVDLTHLKDQGDGKEWLDHVDEDGVPLDVDASYARVTERLTTQDPEKRMPLGKPALPDAEKQLLLDWLQKLKERTR